MSVRASDTSFDTGSQFLTCRVQYLDDTDPFSSTNFAEPTRPPSYTFNVEYPICEQIAGVHRLLKAPHKIGDCTLQLSNTKVYLDLDLSIAEQKEDFDQFFADRKRNSIVIRTLLSVRVHSCIEKLYNSKGRELRRALFSLKQIFQDDKELVHTFVNADGLTCLIKVGAEADQNYQNYILRAMGQIMLYVDGMEGVIQHNDTVSWLYSLIASKFRLVVKTSLKLLLVFVEYSEDNALVLAKAVESVDKRQGHSIWSHLMVVLGEKDGIDSELLVYAMTLINKTLSNISDQDTFYDITDSLEEQKMDSIAQRHLGKKGNDLDLVEQFKIYELALKHEDGEEDINNSSVGSGIKWNRERTKSELTIERKSKRRNSLTSPLTPELPVVPDPEPPKPAMNNMNGHVPSLNSDPSTEPFSSPKPWLKKLHNGTSNFSYARTNSITSSLNDNEEREKRRRERIAKWSEKQARTLAEETPSRHVKKEPPPEEAPPPPVRSSSNNILEQRRLDKRRQRLKLEDTNNAATIDQPTEQKVVVRSRHRRRQESGVQSPPSETHFPSHINEMEKPFSRLDKPAADGDAPAKTVEKTENKDVTTDVITSDTKLMMDMLYANQEVASKQTESDDGSDTPVATDKEPVSTVKAIADQLKVSTIDIAQRLKPKAASEAPEVAEVTTPASTVVKKDSDIMWEKLLQEGSNNDLYIEGFDFKGVDNLDDIDVFSPKTAPMTNGLGPAGGIPPPPMGGIPPPPMGGIPPPPMFGGIPPPPLGGIPPPPPMGGIPPPPTMGGVPPPPMLGSFSPSNSPTPPPNKKRTIRLFWKESSANNNIHQSTTVWSEIDDVKIESEKFIRLFELKSKESTQKKQTTEKRNELRVLDVKRSNAINIGMTKLPPPRTIKHAIIHMDEFALNKEQIEKLLMMVPTEEEISAIQDATQADPDVALGSAEQFLKTLSSISELEARLNLWSFKLDYDTLEKEVAEPLQDIKDAIVELKKNKTLRLILSTLRTIGNLLNNTNVKGFDISYLAKVPEVKDTAHKQTLLHHVTQIVLEKFPESSDLYSELGALTRCSRVDFGDLENTLVGMERRCKNSWDYLKLIAKHESKAAFRNRQSEFLMKCARKIITLKVVHKRLLNRFRATLLFFGMANRTAKEMKVQTFARILSEFALEYRTARDRVFSQKQKKHVKGERNRTRGKMIMEGSLFSNDDDTDSSDLSSSSHTRKFSLTEEQMKQKQMESALHSNHAEVQVEKRTRSRSNRVRKSVDSKSSPKTLPLAPPADDVTDQIMEQLVKTATQLPRERSTPVGRRKRSRNSQRKSLRRTLKNGLTDEERAVIMGSY